MNVKSLDHIHIGCRDVERALGYYRRHFQAKDVAVLKNIHGQALTLIDVGGKVLALSDFPPGVELPATAPDPDAAREGVSRGGVMHLGINVEDVVAAVTELRAAGEPIHAEPVTAEGVTFAYVEAPDGVLIELTQY